MGKQLRWFALLLTTAATLGLVWWADGLAPGELGGHGSGQITGTLQTSGGEPIHDVEVWLTDSLRAPNTSERWLFGSRQSLELWGSIRSVKTNRRGRFCFSYVDPGTYWVGPARIDRNSGDAVAQADLVPLGQKVVLSESMNSPALRLVGHEGQTIQGRVKGPMASVVREGSISAMHVDDGLYFGCGIADDGSFDLGPLIEGEYSLEVWMQSVPRSMPVTAMSGDEGVVLQVRWGRAIEGRAVSFTEPRIASGRAYCSLSGSPEPVAKDDFYENDSFEFPSLSEGAYNVAVVTSAGEAGVMYGVELVHDPLLETYEAGNWDPPESLNSAVLCVIELMPGARLGVDLGDCGADYYTIHLDEALVGFGGSWNSNEIDVVPPGHLIVRAWNWKYELVATRALTLIAREQASVNFDGESL